MVFFIQSEKNNQLKKMKVNYSMWLMVTFILNKLIWGRRVTLSVDEQQLILVYQSLTLRPTSHLGTWVVAQTECPGRSRWSRGSWRPNPHLTLPQSVPSSLSALWVLQHYNSPFLGFVDEVNIIYNVIFFEYNFIIQQIKIVWKESHFLHICQDYWYKKGTRELLHMHVYL